MDPKRDKGIQTRLSHPNIVRMVLDVASGGDLYKVKPSTRGGRERSYVWCLFSAGGMFAYLFVLLEVSWIF